MEISKDVLKNIIREVLEAADDPPCPEFEKRVDQSGILSVKTATVKCEPFDVGVPAKVALKDVVTLEESPRLGCGILEIDHSSYPWTLNYDEFYYVIVSIFHADRRSTSHPPRQFAPHILPIRPTGGKPVQSKRHLTMCSMQNGRKVGKANESGSFGFN